MHIAPGVFGLSRDCLKSLNRLIFSRLLRILAKELPRNKPKLA